MGHTHSSDGSGARSSSASGTHNKHMHIYQTTNLYYIMVYFTVPKRIVLLDVVFVVVIVVVIVGSKQLKPVELCLKSDLDGPAYVA